MKFLIIMHPLFLGIVETSCCHLGSMSEDSRNSRIEASGQTASRLRAGRGLLLRNLDVRTHALRSGSAKFASFPLLQTSPGFCWHLNFMTNKSPSTILYAWAGLQDLDFLVLDVSSLGLYNGSHRLNSFRPPICLKV